MEWNEIGRESLGAARQAQMVAPRSAASRAYYAFHAVLAGALAEAGYVPTRNRQTPRHRDQPRLIGEHLAGRGPDVVRDLRSIFRRLYKFRLDADYNRSVTVDSRVSLQAVRDAHRALHLMEVAP